MQTNSIYGDNGSWKIMFRGCSSWNTPERRVNLPVELLRLRGRPKPGFRSLLWTRQEIPEHTLGLLTLARDRKHFDISKICPPQSSQFAHLLSRQAGGA